MMFLVNRGKALVLRGQGAEEIPDDEQSTVKHQTTVGDARTTA